MQDVPAQIEVVEIGPLNGVNGLSVPDAVELFGEGLRRGVLLAKMVSGGSAVTPLSMPLSQ